MSIGVLFEIVISALSVIGAYSVILELFKLVFVKHRYVIAVRGEGEKNIGDRLFLAGRLARHSTGAERRAVILVTDENETDPTLWETSAEVYVKRK
ncbi:MAG: hypothetical protein IKV54_02815 [Clostridia bacterium]|nr:hypothetical protein [Clostridia bacterium]